MPYATNSHVRLPMRLLLFLLALAGLSLALAACGASFAPTPTAIPLAATATRAVRATERPAEPMPGPTVTPVQGATARPVESATPQAPAGLVGLDALLVEREVQDFLARLS